MMAANTPPLLSENDILEIIDRNGLSVLYQPMVSIKAKCIVGLEGLARAKQSDGTILTPESLFHPGNPVDLRLKVDRICRKQALSAFKVFSGQHSGLTLFLNLDPELLPDSPDKLGYTEKIAKELDLPVDRICLEISARRIDHEMLEPFLKRYREVGFKFSVDHVCPQTPILELLALISPDFIKLQRAFHSPGTNDGQAGLRMDFITGLTAKLGCKAIALGIESQEEAVVLAGMGLHLQQGFFYTKDQGELTKTDDNKPINTFLTKVNSVHSLMKVQALQKVTEKKDLFAGYHKTTSRLKNELAGLKPEEFEALIKEYVRGNTAVVSAFVLDETGQQITERYSRLRTSSQLSAAERSEVVKGGDHSLQDYFLHLQSEYERFVTSPAISLYSREASQLICHRFFSGPAKQFFLCLEFKAG